MWYNIFKIVFRNIARHKLFSFINIVGLALGLTVFILVYLYAKFEFSYDTFHKNYENISRIEMFKDNGNSTRQSRWFPYYVADELKNNYPEITASTRLGWHGRSLLENEDKSVRFFNEEGFYADNDIFKIFTYNILSGDKENILTEPNTIALSKKVADKLYPDESAAGKSITIGKETFKVTAVYDDIPKNSHFELEFLVSMPTFKNATDKEYLNDPTREYFDTYILTAPNTNTQSLSDKIKDLLNNDLQDDNLNTKLYLNPMADIHFHSGEVSKGRDSSFGFMMMYLIVGLFTLTLALVNYMNLSTAFSSVRAKEIGIRKVVGASRKKLLIQFIAESLTITLIALIIAVILVEISLPEFSDSTRTDIKLHAAGKLNVYLEILGLAMLAGVLAGGYPAFFLSGLKPVKILKGINVSKKGGSFARKAFVFFQFFITVLFITYSMTMFQLVSYFNDKSMGFEKERIIVEEFADLTENERENCLLLLNELKGLSNVESACFTVDLPSYISSHMDVTWGDSEKNVVASCYTNVDNRFIDTYSIPLIAGRNFQYGSASDLEKACIVNEMFLKKTGITDPIGKTINDGKYVIIGVVKDFHHRSFSNDIEPMILRYRNINAFNRLYFSIKLTNVNDAAIKEVAKLYGSIFPERLCDLKPFNDVYDKMMIVMMNKLYKIIIYFTIITTFIAAMGMFALVLFTINQKFKEIGIRKALGATTESIFRLLSWDILKILVLANLIGLPVAWYVLDLLLANLPNHMEMKYETFFYTAFISFVVVFAIMIERVFKASRVSPVDAIKYE